MSKISTMPLAASVTGGEMIEVIQNGINKRLPLGTIFTSGKSAYDTAVDAGFQGDQTAWFLSLKGPKGDTGNTGSTGPTGPQGIPGNTGAQGIQGPIGPAGIAGKSAFEVAVTNGFVGDEISWLAALKGVQGIQGVAGATGAAGQSAYQLAVQNGFVGNQAAWLTSLTGPQGLQGAQGLQGNVGPTGATGAPGLSAYQLAVAGGYIGSQVNWLASLAGPQGIQGLTGLTGPTGAQGLQGIKGDTGNTGATGNTGPQGIQGVAGAAGQSAYQVAVATGFVGTQAEWLVSLIGATGAAGPQGIQGPAGAQGIQGLTGATGAQGIQGVPGAVGPAGTNGIDGVDGTDGASTLAQITDATVVGRAVAGAVDKPAARAAISAYGWDTTSKLLDPDAKSSLSITGVEVPGVVNGVDYGVDFTGASVSGAAFQNWITAAQTFASARVAANGKAAFVKLTLPMGAVIKVDQAITIDVGRCHLDLNSSHIVFTNSASAGFIVKSTGFDVGVQALYHQGKDVLCNGMISGPGKATSTIGLLFQGNVPPYGPSTAYYEETPAGSMVSRVSVCNFGQGVVFDYFTYLITLFRVDIFACGTGCLSVGANFAGGERFAFIGCNFSGTSWAIDFSVSTNSEWFFENCSFDYCTQFVRWNGPVTFNFSLCHFEHGGGSKPMFVSLSGNQNGGIHASMCDFISTNVNSYPSYLDMKDMNFFDADRCFAMALKGTTNELCSTYNTRALTGTVAMIAGSAVVDGTGTAFTTTATVGDIVTFATGSGLVKTTAGTVAFTAKVLSIESDTSMTLSSAMPSTVRIGSSTTDVTSFTAATCTASTSLTPWGGRVRFRNTKYGPLDGKMQLFIGGSVTKNYVMYDTGGGMPYGFVQQVGNQAISAMTWSAGVVTVTTSAPHAIPTGATMRGVISGTTPSIYGGEHNCTQTSATTFTYPLAQDPGTAVVRGTFAFANAYGIRLGTDVGIKVVQTGGYASIRKMSTYTGNPQSLWLFIPVPSAPFRNVVFGYDEIAVGAVGTVHPLTRWGSIPNVGYSGNNGVVPDDSNYNTNFADPGGYTPPAVEKTHLLSVPDYNTYSAAPEWATHFVVKFDLSGLALYSAGSVDWKIRNIRLSMS